MTADPFRLLGLPPDAAADDVRRARRELAKRHHPDAGGDDGEMRRINAAAGAALQLIAARHDDSLADRSRVRDAPISDAPIFDRSRDRDAPSFVIEALPAEAFEGLLLVAAELGETIDDDPPYSLDTRLSEPVRCWCRLEVVPDAGSSTVSLTVAAEPGSPAPDVAAVRNLWIDGLNALDWSEL